MSAEAVDDEHDIVAQWTGMAEHAPRPADRTSPIPNLQPGHDRHAVPLIAATVCLAVCGVVIAIAMSTGAL